MEYYHLIKCGHNEGTVSAPQHAVDFLQSLLNNRAEEMISVIWLFISSEIHSEGE